MAIRSALLFALGSALLRAAPCHGETLQAGQEGPSDNIEEMYKHYGETLAKILPGDDSTDFTGFFPSAKRALEILSKSYEGAAEQPFKIHVAEDKIQKTFEDLHKDSSAAIYGELIPESVAAMLAFALHNNENVEWDGAVHQRYEVKPGLKRAGERPKFFDLGSGFGKISELAALLGFDAGGVELESQRISAACDALKRMASPSGTSGGVAAVMGSEEVTMDTPLCAKEADEDSGRLEFHQGSFTGEAVDLADADVIFTDSVFWNDDMMKELGLKASKMKAGSIIVSFKAFPGESFASVNENLALPTSWSPEGTSYKVQKVSAKELKESNMGPVKADPTTGVQGEVGAASGLVQETKNFLGRHNDSPS